MTRQFSVSTISKRYHVVSRDDNWGVKREGAARASRVFKEKSSAVKYAKKVAPKNYDIIIHKKDGSVQRWVTREK